MPFAAKSSPPDPAYCTYRPPKLIQAAQASRNIFTCLPGYLDTECLSAILLEQERRVLWLRLEPEDGDPATFILSLLHAIQAQNPALGADLLAELRRSPGPLTGWHPLFHHLAEILAQALGEHGALVLEHAHKPYPTQPSLGLASHHLIPYLPPDNSCIIITHEHLPTSTFPSQASLYAAKDVRLTIQAGLEMAQDLDMCLPDRIVQQAIHLLDGRAGGMKALFSACEMFGLDFLQDVVQRARNVSHMLSLILDRWLSSLTVQEIANLVLCSRIEYTHPDLFDAQPQEDPMLCPWLQPLTDGWRRTRCLWEGPLRSALRNRSYVESRLARRLVQHLADIGAVDQAIRFANSLSDYDAAAQLIAEHADQWVDLGQWELLEKYLAALPAGILDERPHLLFLQGEMLALHGKDAQAGKIFHKSSKLFLDQGDASGRCLSLLAESSLCARQAEMDQAQLYAQNALEIARQSKLSRLIGWAEWQLGYLAVSLNQLSEALVYLAQSIEDVDDPFIRLVHSQVLNLVQQKVNAHEQIKLHYEAYLQAERSSEDASRQLSRLLGNAPREWPAELSLLGWNDLPLTAKLASPVSTTDHASEPPPTNWRQRLRRYVSHYTTRGVEDEAAHPSITTGDQFPLLLLPSPVEPESPPPPPPPDTPAQLPPPPESVPATPKPKRNTRPAPKPVPVPVNRAQPSLAIFCLGSLRVIQKDKEITEWSSFKARDIFKYLAARPKTPVPKDILIDVFWPDSDPRSARRNLHQAIYSLRQVMRGEQPEFHHIWFENECYFLNPQMDIWLDYQEFESCVAAGRRLEKGGDIEGATFQYIQAVELYQGDFFEDDLYDDWPVVQRQNLLNQFLEVADRLVELYIQQGQHAAAIPLCQKILAKDRTYETAHRQLMQCYLAQGLRHLAIRQYQTCVRALREELGLQPSAETVALYSYLRSPS